MMGKYNLASNVFDTAIERLSSVYADGHRLIVSVSGGKDSSILVQLARIAAEQTDRLLQEVIHRDEEIMYPGTIEHLLWIADQEWTDFHWVYAHQPVVNAYDRENPYWWPFDPELPESSWLRSPPDFAYLIDDKALRDVCTPLRFPPAPGKRTYNVVALRAAESPMRRLGINSSGGYLGNPNRNGSFPLRPMYDWSTEDVWLAFKETGWPYNPAYDQMFRYGLNISALRIAPPTISLSGVDLLQLASKVWPSWFERVCERLPSVRQGVRFGKDWMFPYRRHDELWQDTFYRTCVEEAPEWIANRSAIVADESVRLHAMHADTPFPDTRQCGKCGTNHSSWQMLARVMYTGDPWLSKLGVDYWERYIDCIEPEHFRPGSGVWFDPGKFKQVIKEANASEYRSEAERSF